MSNEAARKVREHLIVRGCEVPAPMELRGELKALVRGAEEISRKGKEYSEIELSPYMKSLLQISGLSAPKPVKAPEVRHRLIAAGI